MNFDKYILTCNHYQYQMQNISTNICRNISKIPSWSFVVNTFLYP